MFPEFAPFKKIPRLSREVVITEKLDGTNAQIYIEHAPEPRGVYAYMDEVGMFLNVHAGSRNRWITPENDNFGFAAWVQENGAELVQLGVGHHYGEWWGRGIQRGYGLDERRFSLFNVRKWTYATAPTCCHVVPFLHTCLFDTAEIDSVADSLRMWGSVAAPGYIHPEGIVIYHTAMNSYFKKTLDDDESGKVSHATVEEE